MHADDDGPLQTQATGETVMRYHLCWKHRDLDGVMALYHPDIQYNDFFQNRVMGLDELREYVRGSMPRNPDEALEHSDRIRLDGNTAFIQYQMTLRGGEGLVSFRSSEAITVRDGLIWRVNEYASLVREQPQRNTATNSRPAASRLGLSPRQLSFMAEDLQQYFQRQQPYLDPELDLQRVAQECGYSRNQISYLLNQVLGQSFYRYVNQARLQHLLAALDAAMPPLRIDELAFAAGFNSLSAFYSCFRQHTGLSPKAYVKQISLRARAHDSP
ncbi:MAG: helix-turn-helix domain-containing protein [Pseudomonas mandelii]|jgi:AraC-like DNA-binding protein/ketosteroid isomerase-like protein|uniref:AraC-type DNA-binding protein n=1 Tax=Pseudomonas mandelii TaxID=75612 RepID=A0ABY0VZA1_9PSED|nr:MULTISPECIES: helix-turn-helix domain-containing protein [Pseudomonas]MDO8407155.1 helix-turn-helix domain-containing protein [Pseudomonas sp.]MSU98106.1 helix-turn-helix domain-containing protein [Pseudomonas mandelii]QQN96252.1 helix-turn-helix domain-containing protein [Pseudomonas sp. SW-3]TWS03689.1 helix-turn-helix domain-containing protein [Pseudomonas mandelii]SDU65056.1 AraC-type DNA-binding protein [Pseudomonas mandelii]